MKVRFVTCLGKFPYKYSMEKIPENGEIVKYSRHIILWRILAVFAMISLYGKFRRITPKRVGKTA